MSLILDALNRADNERKNQDAVPGLNTVHPAPVMVLEDKPETKHRLYFAILISIIALVACVYWVIARPTVTPPVVNQVVPATAPISKETTPPVSTPVQVTTGVAATDNKVVAAEPKASVIAPKATAVVEQLYSAPDSKPGSTDPQVNQLYAAEEPVASESIEDPFAAQPAVAAQPTHITDTTGGRLATEAVVPRTFASITNIQDFNELPWNTKQQIPTISYQRHNYLAGGISSVVINGQTLGEGNIANSSQLIVQEIFQDGVVLKRGDVIFKLRALNGWINM